MKKKTAFLIGLGLLAAVGCFLIYAAGHPEAAFPWSNKITFLLYGMYLWLLLKFLVDIPFLRQRREASASGGIGNALIYFAMAAVFLAMELTGKEAASVYTILRGFIFLGGIDLGAEALLLWKKQRNHG